MEVDLDDLNPLEAVQFLASNGTLPASQTLADVIGEDEYATVARLANSLDLPEMAIARLEPWAAAMVLTQFALMKTGYDPQLGIDMQLTERARGDGKPIDGLETIVDQLGIFDSRSQQEQISFLLDAADDVPEMQQDLDRLIAAWRTGDLRAPGARIPEGARPGAGAVRRIVRRAQPQVAAEDRGAARRRSRLPGAGGHAALRRPGWTAGTAEARGPQAGGRARGLAGRQPLGHAQLRDLPRPDRAGFRWHRRARLPGLAAGQSPLLENPKFSRVASRVGMLILLVGFVFVARHLKVADRQQSRLWPARRDLRARSWLIAVLLGALLMLPLVGTMLLLDMRELKPGVALAASACSGSCSSALVIGPGGGADRGNLPARRDADRDHARIRRGAGDRADVAGLRGVSLRGRQISRGAGRRRLRQRPRHAGGSPERLRGPARHPRLVPVPHRRGSAAGPACVCSPATSPPASGCTPGGWR